MARGMIAGGSSPDVVAVEDGTGVTRAETKDEKEVDLIGEMNKT